MNRKFRHTILFSLMGGLVLSASAWAAWDHDGMFKRMDTNNDGRISASEHAAGAQAMFTRMDANHDAKLSGEEMAAGHKAMMHGDHDKDHRGMHGDRMARMDSNHDGVLTAAENAAAAQAMFDRMDSNHDGKVTTDEIEAGHKAMRGDHDSDDDAMTSGDNHGMHGRGEMHEGMMREGMGGMRGMMDANHDGMITAAEHAAAAQAMFARMDSNHDGFISKPEMEAGHTAPKSR